MEETPQFSRKASSRIPNHQTAYSNLKYSAPTEGTEKYFTVPENGAGGVVVPDAETLKRVRLSRAQPLVEMGVIAYASRPATDSSTSSGRNGKRSISAGSEIPVITSTV